MIVCYILVYYSATHLACLPSSGVSGHDIGICEINIRSKNTRYGSQTPFPQRSMLTK